MCFGPELIEAYPEAKVILTNRDIDSWHKSFTEAAVAPFYSVPGRITGFLSWAMHSPFRYGQPVWKMVLEEFFQINPHAPNGIDTSAAKGVYSQHYAQIRKLVPKDRLLEYQVQDGWEPLCKFLGKEVPDVPFPRGNEKADLHKRIEAYSRAEAKIFGMKLTQLVGVVLVAWAVKRNTLRGDCCLSLRATFLVEGRVKDIPPQKL
ncbi:hypothetical protein LTS15_000559 [Exophiala xenobiotica]|nr:hypothetical protein LTS15_000559 [Exophiala xenobiotica]